MNSHCKRPRALRDRVGLADRVVAGNDNARSCLRLVALTSPGRIEKFKMCASRFVPMVVYSEDRPEALPENTTCP